MAFELAFPKESTEMFNSNREIKIRHMREIISNEVFKEELSSFDDPSMMVVLATVTIREGNTKITSTVAGINGDGDLIRIVTTGNISRELGWTVVDADVFIENKATEYVDNLEEAIFDSTVKDITYDITDGDPAGEFGTIDDFLERSRWRVNNAGNNYKRTCDKFIYEVYFYDGEGDYNRGIVVTDTADYVDPSVLTDIDPSYKLKDYGMMGIVTAQDIGLYRVMISSSLYPTPTEEVILTEEQLAKVNLKGKTKREPAKRTSFRFIEYPEPVTQDIVRDDRSIRVKSKRKTTFR